ncbi:unnamed protein product [Heterotrigona itama]|uniref:Uncharacterized protein n=1 Tax=Heterotrigona itama TaxID=395501 RepID=A0A6V7HCI7_9HYME|nr:unnamed protein product [Heterotrigona itama]
MHYDRPRNFSFGRLFASPRRPPGELYRKKENSSAERPRGKKPWEERSRVQPQVLPKGAWCSNEMSSGNSRKETSRFVFRTRYGVATRTVVERRFEPSQGRGWVDSRNKLLNKRKKEVGKEEAKSEKRVVVDSCAPVRLPTIKKKRKKDDIHSLASRYRLVQKRDADHHRAGPCPLAGLVKSQNNTVGESGVCIYRVTNLSDGVNRTV